MSGVTVLACLLFATGIFGIPSSETEVSEARTFDFQTSNWNPANWFGETYRETSEKQLAALYKTVDCLVKNDKKDCMKLVDEARIQFEPKKKKTENSTGKPANSTA